MKDFPRQLFLDSPYAENFLRAASTRANAFLRSTIALPRRRKLFARRFDARKRVFAVENRAAAAQKTFCALRRRAQTRFCGRKSRCRGAENFLRAASTRANAFSRSKIALPRRRKLFARRFDAPKRVFAVENRAAAAQKTFCAPLRRAQTRFCGRKSRCRGAENFLRAASTRANAFLRWKIALPRRRKLFAR